MKKYIVFDWTPGSEVADIMLGTISYIDPEVEAGMLEDGTQQYGYHHETELVKLADNLMRGREFYMTVLYHYDHMNPTKGRRLLAYYEIPGVG